jgi:hypothetical protein
MDSSPEGRCIMSPRPHLLILAVFSLCALVFAGCSQQDGASSPTAPSLEAPSAYTSSLAFGREAPGLVSRKERECVTETIDSEGGVIECGRISVTFPKGSLPGKTEVTLIVWGVDEVYFTVEPRDLLPLLPVQFSFRVDGGEGSDLTYYWNDKGWREPLPSWLNKEKDLLLSQADFLGEFLVAPKDDGKGRAGW